MQTHHARLVFSVSQSDLKLFVTDCQRDSEVTLYTYTTVAIADVQKQLMEAAYRKPSQHRTRTLIISASGIGREAQNALLKILEEPPLSTRFVLWLCPGAALLSTLRSRLSHEPFLSRVQSETDETTTLVFTNFLKSAYAARLELIATVIKNKDLVTLAALSSAFKEYIVNATHVTQATRTQSWWCLSQLELSGASKKMLWEEIALVLPVEAKR